MTSESLADKYDDNNNKRKNGHIKLRRKIFIERNSLLVDLSDSKYLKTFYNFLCLVWLSMALKIIIIDYTTTGSVNIFESYKTAFTNYDKALWILMLIFGSLLLNYPFFMVWVKMRTQLIHSSFLATWDSFCLLFHVAHQTSTYVMVIWAFYKNEFFIGCGMVLSMEQIVCSMKAHAFIRTNVLRALDYGPKRMNSTLCPKFKSFFYFLYAPTFIYQDEYPRLKKVRWSTLIWFIFQFFVGVTLMGFLFEQYFWNNIRNFGKPDFNQSVLLYIVNSFLPGLVLFFFTFYCYCHAWLNAWAEALRFADRKFYGDYWNCTNYSDYFRNANIIVQDFLYHYIYMESYEKYFPGNHLVAIFSTFYISAIAHEFILGLSLGFFYPVMLFLFGVVGVVLTFVMGKTKSNYGNFIYLLTVFIGHGLMMSLYCIEYAARQNCPRINNTWWDYVIPRSWNCKY